MPSNKTNSATTPGRARIALAALAAMAVIAALLLGGLVALAQNDRGAVPNLRLSSASPGELTISWDAPDPAPSDYGSTGRNRAWAFSPTRTPTRPAGGTSTPAARSGPSPSPG